MKAIKSEKRERKAKRRKGGKKNGQRKGSTVVVVTNHHDILKRMESDFANHVLLILEDGDLILPRGFLVLLCRDEEMRVRGGSMKKGDLVRKRAEGEGKRRE